MRDFVRRWGLTYKISYLIRQPLHLAGLPDPRNLRVGAQAGTHHSHDQRQRLSGIVSKPVEKVVGRLTLLQGISQVLSHRKTVL
jgi:hypothetical protein